MHANSPSSLLASLTLHGFLAALLFVTTVFVAQSDKVQPVIFELVAGAPTAPDELFAPALGNTTKPVKLDVPKVNLPPEIVEPVVEETPAPPEPVVQEKAPPVKPAPVDKAIAKDMKKSAKVSYQEYLKAHPTLKISSAPKPRTARVPKIDTQGIIGGVAGGSTANTRGGGGGKALSREQQSQLDTYISMLIQELKKAHELPPGVSDQLEAKVTFDITASGAILNPRISKSSGNRAFDESVLDAFRRMRSIGPTPTRRPDTWTVTFRMNDED
jgi:TonB family protein